MTDETKGDGMTLEQSYAAFEEWHNNTYGTVGVRSLERYPEETGLGYVNEAVAAQFFLFRKLTADQSAMRVDAGNADPLTPANSHDQELTSRRIGWMLESTDGKGWWTGRQIWDFTKDPNNAAVFTESAARFRESIFNGAAIATEHVWLGKEQSAMRVDEAFERGWRTACDWAKRPDMIYDIGSPAYERDKRAALQAAIGGKE